MTRFLPSLDAAKAQARAFRANQAAQGRLIPHAAALEVIAQSFGYRDWNPFHAAIGNAPRPPVMVGDLVPGHYLKQAFLGEVLSVIETAPGHYEVELELDTPVDVVTFDSFSNFRSRIRKTIGSDGRSLECTSDGIPHLVLWE